MEILVDKELKGEIQREIFRIVSIEPEDIRTVGFISNTNAFIVYTYETLLLGHRKFITFSSIQDYIAIIQEGDLVKIGFNTSSYLLKVGDERISKLLLNKDKETKQLGIALLNNKIKNHNEKN